MLEPNYSNIELNRLDIVGIFPNYASAYAIWEAEARPNVDIAPMRNFIVHLHRLLDPESTGRAAS